MCSTIKTPGSSPAGHQVFAWLRFTRKRALPLVCLERLLHELHHIGVALRLGQLRRGGGGRGPLLEQPLHDIEPPLLARVHERRRVARVGALEQRGRLRQQLLRVAP